MNTIKLIPIYLRWHYSIAFVDMIRIDGNIFWFLWHFFSVPDTFRTFFSPWERMGDKYKKGLDIERIASTFVVNTLMRIVGMIMRTILLLFALFCSFVALVVVVVCFFLWIFIPAILILLAFFGIMGLYNKSL
jgi:hypothetical protein